MSIHTSAPSTPSSAKSSVPLGDPNKAREARSPKLSYPSPLSTRNQNPWSPTPSFPSPGTKYIMPKRRIQNELVALVLHLYFLPEKVIAGVSIMHQCCIYFTQTHTISPRFKNATKMQHAAGAMAALGAVGFPMVLPFGLVTPIHSRPTVSLSRGFVYVQTCTLFSGCFPMPRTKKRGGNHILILRLWVLFCWMFSIDVFFLRVFFRFFRRQREGKWPSLLFFSLVYLFRH